MSRQRILFVCIHNSARSQMAEELLRKFAGDRFDTESAGIEPGTLNPVVIDVLRKEEGIDISGKKTKAVFDMIRQGKSYHYVVTVCDETSAERCPVFPGVTKRLHWGFADPSSFQGSYEEKYAGTRLVKEQIRAKILEFLSER